MAILAQPLPTEILSLIFNKTLEEACNSSETSQEPEHAHGGRLVGWNSHESVKGLNLVCKAWVVPATELLYRSIAIWGRKSAEAFVETTLGRPHLARDVTYLVIGLGKNLEGVGEDTEHARESEAVVEILEVCDNLQHLHVRPLHHSVRNRLVLAVAAQSLSSLVYIPLLNKGVPSWDLDALRIEDLPTIVQPGMKELELEFTTSKISSPSRSTSPFTPFQPNLTLTRLRLYVDLPETMLCNLLASSKSLQVADIYLEQPLFSEDLGDAILASKDTLRQLSFVSNPLEEKVSTIVRCETPLFNGILPRFSVLQELIVTSTEIDSSCLPLLPPSLHRLSVKAYNPRGGFLPTKQFFDDLESRKIAFSLKELQVADSDETWIEEDVVKATESCRARGIAFEFISEEWSESEETQ